MTYALVIEFIPGTSLEKAHSMGVDLCTRLNVPWVRFNFNGVSLLVSKTSIFEELEKYYYRSLEHTELRKKE
jgi:hypothetical protein